MKKIEGKKDINSLFRREVRRVENSLELLDDFYKDRLNWFDRFSDDIATIGGSWAFIIIYLIVVVLWIVSGVFRWSNFDPYPFVMLNTVLSIVAGLQAPVILMAQLRSSNRDRLRVEMDLKKDARDLQIDQHALELMLELKKDIKYLRNKAK